MWSRSLGVKESNSHVRKIRIHPRTMVVSWVLELILPQLKLDWKKNHLMESAFQT